jgi:hypothetical protein
MDSMPQWNSELSWMSDETALSIPTWTNEKEGYLTDLGRIELNLSLLVYSIPFSIPPQSCCLKDWTAMKKQDNHICP